MYRFITALAVLTLFSIVHTQKSVNEDNDIPLEIHQGKLVGHWKTSLKGRKFAAFEGIPFAKPPTGSRRFKRPQSPEPWKGVLQAKNISRYCIQWEHVIGDDYHSIVGDEDCLYLNVYSPKLSKSSDLPVIIYIHGGAFIFGTGVIYEPDFLMDKDVIFVNINYRLGPLGFLSTQDKVVPGNNGMKDQVMALKWVKNNIQFFGGNPNSITVMGMSAGGASVHYHMISPLSKGLFQRGISQSGTVCCPWTLQEKPLEKALLIGSHLGCPTDCTKKMIECLRNRPAAAITATVNLFMPFLHSPFSPFAPVVEPADTEYGFITMNPYQSIQNGAAQDIPWLNSLNADEGLYPAAIFFQDRNLVEEIFSKWNELAPHLFDFNYTLPVSKHEEAARRIMEAYYLNSDTLEENWKVKELTRSLGDRHFDVYIEKCIRLQASLNKQPIYLYQFDYKGESGLGKHLSRSTENLGVSHGDDTGYSIKTAYMDPTTNSRDRDMIEFMTNLIYSFAKEGKPEAKPVGYTARFNEIEWKPVGTSDQINYLQIKSASWQRMSQTYHFGESQFWESLNLKENENVATLRDEL